VKCGLDHILVSAGVTISDYPPVQITLDFRLPGR